MGDSGGRAPRKGDFDMTKQQFAPPSQVGRRAVITGIGGLGYETALGLAKAGAAVVLAGRNEEKGVAALAAICAAVPGARVEFEKLDLACLLSVRDFAERMQQRGEPIDILLNNAGIMSPPSRQNSADGYELQFAVNYLGHFALTTWLMPLLRLRAGARVVSVTSLAQHYAKLDLDEAQNPANYRAGPAYCLSKLLIAMFAVELQRRCDANGWNVASLAAHPGFAGTGLFQTGGKISNFLSSRVIVPLIGQSAANGALPQLYAATAHNAVGGRLYGPKGFKEMRGQPGECRFAPAVHDVQAATKLWELSGAWIGTGTQRS
jgi:NAD(P)-dependent dehydrogenase (short-subunit alcohol dehydrogenase family)